MRHDDDGEAVAAFIVAVIGILLIGVVMVLGALIQWIADVTKRAHGQPALPIAWLSLLSSGVIALLLLLGHLTTAAGWTAGVGCCLFLLLLALADAQSRAPHEPEAPPELPVEDLLSLPWWNDEPDIVRNGRQAQPTNGKRS